MSVFEAIGNTPLGANRGYRVQNRKRPAGPKAGPAVTPRPRGRLRTPLLISLTLALLAACALAGLATVHALRSRNRPSPVLNAVEVVRTFPHDPLAYTQGLTFFRGTLFEGTGQKGSSSLREVNLETGQVKRIERLPDELFGEGIAVLEHEIFQLTWESQVGFVYDRSTFERLRTFTYPFEGWGITHDGQYLIVSDGSSTLRFMEPTGFTEFRRIDVTDRGEPVSNLNELEFIKGEIYANVWRTDTIVRIDPETGHVRGWIDASGLLTPEELAGDVDVLNGIAYDAERDRLIVTGKLWPKMFEVRLLPG